MLPINLEVEFELVGSLDRRISLVDILGLENHREDRKSNERDLRNLGT